MVRWICQIVLLIKLLLLTSVANNLNKHLSHCFGSAFLCPHFAVYSVFLCERQPLADKEILVCLLKQHFPMSLFYSMSWTIDRQSSLSSPRRWGESRHSLSIFPFIKRLACLRGKSASPSCPSIPSLRSELTVPMETAGVSHLLTSPSLSLDRSLGSIPRMLCSKDTQVISVLLFFLLFAPFDYKKAMHFSNTIHLLKKKKNPKKHP